ncbi:MAG: four helix bundle protein [bacterium]
MRIRRFEEIDAWKTARILARAIYNVSMTGAFQRDFPLRDQIRRAATSIMANIAEGDKADHCASQVSNFIRFLLAHSNGPTDRRRRPEG